MAHFLLRYGEIALKGQNQHFFLEALVRNVRRALADLGPAQVHAAFGRVVVTSEADPVGYSAPRDHVQSRHAPRR